MMRTCLAVLLLLLPGLGWAQAPVVDPTPGGQIASTAAPSPQAAPRPGIWLISDADTRIYLFGTVHLLRPELRWRTPTFDRIAREADELGIEVSDRDLHARGPNPLALMLMSKSVPLLQRVSPDRRAGLARLLEATGIPEGAFDQFETWGAAVVLGFAQVAREWGTHSSVTEARFDAGVEHVLMREFRASNRPVSGAESAAKLMSGFRGMPLSEQRAMLEEAVDAYLNRPGTTEPWEGGWLAGDLDRIAALLAALPPRLNDLLVTRRNRGFADWVATRLGRPGTVLFAVGIGHLAGPNSVQSMLESRGMRVQRIQ